MSPVAARPGNADARRALRNAFGAFPTGVTVVTTRQPDGTPRGFTANSFTSVSLDPPMLLVCIGKNALSCQLFAETPHFAVSVLGEAHKQVSNLFASQRPDKFENAPWHAGAADMPLIDGALSGFVCKRDKVVDAGDHVVLIGEVLDYETGGGAPLGYHRGAYFSLGAEEDKLVAAAARSGDVRIGAILHAGDEIWLIEAADGTLSVPTAPPGTVSHEGLLNALAAKGLKLGPQTLYAVYEDTVSGRLGIFYHGTAGGVSEGHVFKAPLDAIPLGRIADRAQRFMAGRFAKEYRMGRFGIYQGTHETGRVHQIAASQDQTT